VFGTPGSVRNFRGLILNTSVNESIFKQRFVHVVEDVDVDEEDVAVAEEDVEERAQQFAEFLRNKHNLSTWRIVDCDFYNFPQISSALSDLLVWRDSQLRCFDVAVLFEAATTATISMEAFQGLMTATSNSIRLEHFCIHCTNLNEDLFALALADALPSFKVKEIIVKMAGRSTSLTKARLLGALKRNYTVQSFHCKTFPQEDNWFDDADQARLEFYLNRNRQLAQWIKNPKLVLKSCGRMR